LRSANDDTLRILMAGPLPPPLGGTTVSFRSLVDALEARGDVAVRVVATGGVRGRGLAGIAELFRLARRVSEELRSADVVTLFASTTGLHVLAPLFSHLARRRAVPLVIRKFGGTDFSDYAPLRRASILWGLRRAALYLAQTKSLVRQAVASGILKAEWYPNSRPMPELPEDHPRDGSCRRFVFLGHVTVGKGIRELLDASDGLPEDVSVSVYGPLDFDIAPADFAGRRRVSYRGEVRPEEVHGVLAEHDALVLPSHHLGEGYPGVILEAYAAGLPVVSTRWRAIPELVEDKVTGLLVPPYEVEALRVAMSNLYEDPGLYARLRAGVRERRGEYSETVWSERFVEYCRRAVRE
jgi:glycosyltransferase involved in cell wall biosynthesis